MTILTNKIDFVVTIEVRNANPNGDPLAGNAPRTDIQGYGIMSDVSIKRKIRNRMQDEGHEIFVKSNDRNDDGFSSLQKRYENQFGGTTASRNKEYSNEEISSTMCKSWLDVRSFGQVVTFDKRSIGIRGPISIMIAKSLSPVNAIDMQITRSSNAMEASGASSRSSDTMGTKQFIDYGVYVIKGSINPYFAELTGFTVEDAEVVKESLRTLFVNDASSARPEGSMEVKDVFWFKHPSKLGAVSSAKVFDCLEYEDINIFEVDDYADYKVQLNNEKIRALEDQGVQIERFKGL